MKRFTLALFVTSVALFLFSLANLSPGVSAQLPTFPLQQEVFGTVDVGNLPLNADGNLITAPATPPQLEVLSGGFKCGTGSGGKFEVRLSFVGTAGTPENGYDVIGVTPDFDDRVEICNDQVSRIIAKADSLDCTTGQVGFLLPGGFAFPANLAFVCQGSRNSLVNIIVELTREFLADSP